MKTKTNNNHTQYKSLHDKITQLESSLKEAQSNANYYKGKYDESRLQQEQKEKEQREQHLRDYQYFTSMDKEVLFLRNLIIQLTLTPDKIAAMQKNPNNITTENPLRGY